MGFAILTILVSVLSGTLLAFLPRQKATWMGPMRTFGLAAAISVVALHMVPESVEAIGAWAVVALVLGLILPALLGRLGSLLWRAGHRSADPRHVALEAGYAGLLVHKVGDGIALGVYAGELHPAGGTGFATALAAHIVPVVAIVVLTFDSVRGRGSALLRALGLAVAGVLGVLLTHSVKLGELSEAHGWLSAVAAGMLLHVVLHDLAVDLPKTAPARSLDLGVAALGLSVSALGGAAHGAHGTEQASEALLAALLALSIQTGPALIGGLALGSLLTCMRARSRTFLATFDELFLQTGSWILVGLLLAALVEVSLAPAAYGGLSFGALSLASSLALFSYLCPPAAIPLALVLLDKGLTPGGAVLGLLTGGTGHLLFVRRRFRPQATISALIGTTLGAIVALGSSILWEKSRFGLGSGGARPDTISLVAAGLAACVLVRAVYLASFRGFLLPIDGGSAHSGDSESAEHHGHSHGATYKV